MLYELYLPNNVDPSTLEINVEGKQVKYIDNTGQIVQRSDMSFLYKIKGIDKVILLGKSYPLKTSATSEVLKDFKDVVDLLGFDFDDLYLVVRYVLYDFQLIEQLTVYSHSQKAYLPLQKLKQVVDNQKVPLFDNGKFQSSFIMDLIKLVDNKNREQYQLNFRRDSLDVLNVKHIEETAIKERLDIIEEDGYHEGIEASGNKRILNLQPKSNIGLLYKFTETGYLEIFSEKYRKIPTYDIAENKYVSQDFIDRHGSNLGIVKLYPTLEGYKFYHRNGTLFVEIFTKESEKIVLEGYALSLSHFLLENNLKLS